MSLLKQAVKEIISLDGIPEEHVEDIEITLLGYSSQLLIVLYKECEHGDEEHRKWLKDKFDNFLKAQIL